MIHESILFVRRPRRPRPAPLSRSRALAGRSLPLLCAVLCMLLGLLAGGCASRTPVDAPSIIDEPLPAAATPVYRLRAGDLLQVKFWGADELDEQQTIRPDGRISMPFLDEIEAAGMTPQELDDILTQRYAGELADPNLTVIVQEASPLRIYIGGEVGLQGSVNLADNMTLFRAIQQAGGFLTSARRKQVLVIRRQPGGDAIARSVDLRPVLSGRDPSLDVVLQADDIVYVPRTKIKNVNLFIDQYIDDVIPLQSVVSGALLGNVTASDDNNSTPAVVTPVNQEGGT